MMPGVLFSHSLRVAPRNTQFESRMRGESCRFRAGGVIRADEVVLGCSPSSGVRNVERSYLSPEKGGRLIVVKCGEVRA